MLERGRKAEKERWLGGASSFVDLMTNLMGAADEREPQAHNKKSTFP